MDLVSYYVNAALPVTGGVVLVILSVVLTLIGGLIPSRKAAKQIGRHTVYLINIRVRWGCNDIRSCHRQRSLTECAVFIAGISPVVHRCPRPLCREYREVARELIARGIVA